jgi:hypothetical protein
MSSPGEQEIQEAEARRDERDKEGRGERGSPQKRAPPVLCLVVVVVVL